MEQDSRINLWKIESTESINKKMHQEITPTTTQYSQQTQLNDDMVI